MRKFKAVPGKGIFANASPEDTRTSKRKEIKAADEPAVDTELKERVKVEVRDYLKGVVSDRFEDWITDISDNLAMVVSSKFDDYDIDWAEDDWSPEFGDYYSRTEDFQSRIVDKVVEYLVDELFGID